MNNQIAFIITTFQRPELLKKCLLSLKLQMPPFFEIIVIDQSDEKIKEENWKIIQEISKGIYYIQTNFNSGLSHCRNLGVETARKCNCGNFVFIGSDSFLFHEDIKKINELVEILENTKYSFIGLELLPTTANCGWEGKLNLIPGECFELDFIDKTEPQNKYFGTPKPSKEWQNKDGSPALVGNVIPAWEVEICRNVFLSKIDPLLNVPWDEDLKLAEHEDRFMRLKQAGYTGLWTNYITVEKMTDRPNEYADYRKQNWNEGQKLLLKKWEIKTWIRYKHLQEVKDYYGKLQSNK